MMLLLAPILSLIIGLITLEILAVMFLIVAILKAFKRTGYRGTE
ncbi:MAG: hypothetical protein R2880_04865 [Deinococcales bacterium]